MTDITSDTTVTDEDREVILAFLRGERANGVEHPLLPMDIDLDGDGRADAFGLNAEGNLIVVPSVDLEYTVYESTGNGEVAPND